MGHWELGIGNWELGIGHWLSYHCPMPLARCPLRDAPCPMTPVASTGETPARRWLPDAQFPILTFYKINTNLKNDCNR